MSTTGGACFTPRLPERPKYPPFGEVAAQTFLSYLRVTVLCTLATLGIEPFYRSFLTDALAAGYNERVIFTFLSLLVHTFAYVTINGFFFAAEANGWCEQYRFYRKPYQVPSWELIRRTLLEAFIGQLVTGPVILYFAWHAFKYFGMPALTAPLPSFTQMLYGFALANFVNDVGFYWSHRVVHSTALYGAIHKQHHTYTGSIGMAAEYASPVEQIVSNQLPSVGGCLFFGAHPLVFWVWVLYRLEQTYEGHSGFCFHGTFLHSLGLTNSEGAAYHDFHHSGNRGNFGAGWLDWSFGTMDAWLALGGTEGYIAQCRRYRADAEKRR